MALDHATLSLELKSSDAIVPDLMRIGGVSGWLKTAALAEALQEASILPPLSTKSLRIRCARDTDGGLSGVDELG